MKNTKSSDQYVLFMYEAKASLSQVQRVLQTPKVIAPMSISIKGLNKGF